MVDINVASRSDLCCSAWRAGSCNAFRDWAAAVIFSHEMERPITSMVNLVALCQGPNVRSSARDLGTVDLLVNCQIGGKS